jgi:hypothetical protein
MKEKFFMGCFISVILVDFGFTRVMITGAIGGQVITAVAICVHKQFYPVDLLEQKNLKELQ